MPIPDPNMLAPGPGDGWWQAILAALSGGVITKFLDHKYGAKQSLQDRLSAVEERLMAELRKEKEELQKEISTLRKELDDWKTKYFDMVQAKIQVEHELLAAQLALKQCEESKDIDEKFPI